MSTIKTRSSTEGTTVSKTATHFTGIALQPLNTVKQQHTAVLTAKCTATFRTHCTPPVPRSTCNRAKHFGTQCCQAASHNCVQWRTTILFSGAGVQQTQLMTEGRGNGDLGAVAPQSGVPLDWGGGESPAGRYATDFVHPCLNNPHFQTP
jgi:hypothetical protein